ncbi:MAG: hypothetical protein KF749_17630 [Bacteroidetes bacterium]|nr:hypothetical protein [Bacteroidota bacterium]MCW5894735.1 hypothetical protein [Bacteroidota bacterium]
MANPNLLGIPNQFYTRPLTEALRTRSSLQLKEDARPNLARQLLDHELAAALLSPLDYAKESSDYRIIPGAAVASYGEIASLVIRFREGVHHIRTLAVDPRFASEIVLAKIILAESFDIEPAIRPTMDPVDTILQSADAVLLAGDDAFLHGRTSSNAIDLVEEWNELTGLPFVHAIWCTRDQSLTDDEVDSIQQAAVKGVAGIDDILLRIQKDEREDAKIYLESFSYDLDGTAREGLAEFMKYLYYHGIQPDVAELNFLKMRDEKKDDDLLQDISPN